MMATTLIILLLTSAAFFWGKARSDIIALCSLILLLTFGILTPDEGLSGFSNQIVIMLIGLFVVSGGIMRTGLAKLLGRQIVLLSGKSELRLFILTVLATAVLGAFISNIGIVAIMLPIAVSLAASTGVNPAQLMMPIAFASSMGGMLTLIGTPPNLVIESTLKNAGYNDLHFFSFTPVGIVCVAAGTLILLPLTRFFLKRNHSSGNKQEKHYKSSFELADEYRISSDLYRLRVKKESTLKESSLRALEIPEHYNVMLVEIRTQHSSGYTFFRSITDELATPDSVLHEKDILYVKGKAEDVQRLARDYKLGILSSRVTEKTEPTPMTKLEFRQIGIAEILPLPHATILNTPVKSLGLREKYQLNILGIKRGQEHLLKNLGAETVQEGDILLIQGAWANIARLSDSPDEWVVLGEPLQEAAKVTLDDKAPVAAIILLLMIAGMISSQIPAVTAVIIAALLMIVTGCIRNVEEAYKTINWESVVLIAAMLPMSLALQKTGASALVTEKLVSGLGQYGPFVLLAGIYVTSSILTMFISNTASTVLLAPIALQAAISLKISPYAFLMAVTVGTGMCFASPFSTPANALVMRAGGYVFADYVKVGLPLQILLGVIMIIVLPLLFPFGS